MCLLRLRMQVIIAMTIKYRIWEIRQLISAFPKKMAVKFVSLNYSKEAR